MDDWENAVRRLYQTLRACDWAGRQWRRFRRPPVLNPFRPGVSVLIPERANPVLLEECLASANRACREIDEPCEVIVVVNGSPQSLYAGLAPRHKQVRWIFSGAPLWFFGAIRRGLQAARYDWVYLLNNDMVLDASTLSSLLPWRAPDVFGIASQIFFRNPTIRREETGWTVCEQANGLLEIQDALPEDDVTVRGTFYPGGGASLFRRSLLLRVAQHCSVYAPFYWEDVEWGACAWRLGYDSLYCPASKAWHWHRQTNRRFFCESEIDRIQNRNRFIFHFRNGPCPESFDQFRELLAHLDEASLAEVLSPWSIFKVGLGRLRNRSCLFRDLPLEGTWRRRYAPAAVPAHLVLE